MPNDKLEKIAPIKEKKFKSPAFMDTYDRQDRQSLVNPVGRVTSVRDQAPKEEVTSVFDPDKTSPGSRIQDR